MKNKKKPDDSWFGFFRDNPIYGAIVVILVLAALSVAPFEPGICTADEQNPCKYVVRYHLIHWLFAFVDKYSGGISAITAVIIAAFTYTLKNASIEQGRLTERSVRASERALTEIERPWLFVQIIRGTQKSTDYSGKDAWCVAFRIVNYGKAPAVIIKCSTCGSACFNPEAVPRDDLLDVIGPGQTKDAQHYFPGETNVKVLDFFDLENPFFLPETKDGQRVFAAVELHYTGVDPSLIFETYSAWCWAVMDNFWVLYEDPKYNRRT